MFDTRTDIASMATPLVELLRAREPRRPGRPPLAPWVKARVALRKHTTQVVPLDRIQPDYDPIRGPSNGPAEDREDALVMILELR